MILILTIGFVAIGTFILQMFLPWWVVGIIPLLVGYTLSPKAYQAWWAGFLGTFLLWGVHALILHFHTDGILSDKMAELFFMPSGLWLVFVTAMFGAIPAGLSALAGFYLKRLRISRR